MARQADHPTVKPLRVLLDGGQTPYKVMTQTLRLLDWLYDLPDCESKDITVAAVEEFLLELFRLDGFLEGQAPSRYHGNHDTPAQC